MILPSSHHLVSGQSSCGTWLWARLPQDWEQSPLLANDPVPLPCSVTPEELYCLNYYQKEIPNINMSNPNCYLGQIVCGTELLKSLFIWGAAHQEAHWNADLLPAEVPIRRTVDRGLVTLFHWHLQVSHALLSDIARIWVFCCVWYRPFLENFFLSIIFLFFF